MTNGILTEYITAAMDCARYEFLEGDVLWVGTIPGCQGVIAWDKSYNACRAETRSVLEDWILVRLCHGLNLPAVGDNLGIDVSGVGREIPIEDGEAAVSS